MQLSMFLLIVLVEGINARSDPCASYNGMGYRKVGNVRYYIEESICKEECSSSCVEDKVSEHAHCATWKCKNPVGKVAKFPVWVIALIGVTAVLFVIAIILTFFMCFSKSYLKEPQSKGTILENPHTKQKNLVNNQTGSPFPPGYGTPGGPPPAVYYGPAVGPPSAVYTPRGGLTNAVYGTSGSLPHPGYQHPGFAPMYAYGHTPYSVYGHAEKVPALGYGPPSGPPSHNIYGHSERVDHTAYGPPPGHSGPSSQVFYGHPEVATTPGCGPPSVPPSYLLPQVALSPGCGPPSVPPSYLLPEAAPPPGCGPPSVPPSYLLPEAAPPPGCGPPSVPPSYLLPEAAPLPGSYAPAPSYNALPAGPPPSGNHANP